MEGDRPVRKVTVSLPRHLLEYADRVAAERGVSRSQLVAELIAEMAARDRDAVAAEGYCFYAQEAEELRQRVAQQFNCQELLVTEFTPVMGAHAGPGLLGIAFFAE